MEKPDRESQDLQELGGEEMIELVIPPSTNATLLVRFMFRLKETCHSDRHSGCIMQTVGSFSQGTVITISLDGSSLANILDKISGMSEVDKVGEDPLASGVVSRFPKIFAGLQSSRIGLSNRFPVTLKETSIAR